MRKIIQITSTSVTTTNKMCLVALCEDGSLWQYDAHTMAWERFPNVPQGVEPTDAWPRS